MIEIQQVWKSYGATAAVRGLSLRVPRGTVYGFLGPNGAGKSTTIRMIVGLQRPDRGSIRLFGRPLERAALARIGSLVEAPSLYPHLTGRENLEVHRRLLDLRRERAIDDALDTVGLGGAAADRAVYGYSSGMKQRLGLAQALLGNPELLILDEPTNGLDPAGIHEVRALIRQLPERRGVTIFLSSHLLAEVEQVATHLAIIAGGESKFEGTAAELRQLSAPVIEVEVNDVQRATAVLLRQGIRGFEKDQTRISIADANGFAPADVNRMLVEAGVGVSEMVTKRAALEDVFLKLTSAAASAESGSSAEEVAAR